MPSRRAAMKILGGAALAGLAATSAVAAETFVRLRIARYALTPAGWPSDLRLRAVIMSDLHASLPWMGPARIRRIVNAMNALQPDIHLLLGDYLSGMELSFGQVAPEDWGAELARLNAPLGVHAVLGNHDWADDPIAEQTEDGPSTARQALQDAGIAVYENDARRIETDKSAFWLAGLGDQMGRYRTVVNGKARSVSRDDLPGTVAQIDDDGAPALLMAHEPDIFPDVPDRIGVTLSGHTHGGQIVPFGWAPVVPRIRRDTHYRYGHYREGERDLIVTGGVGCSILPIRIGMAPEIVLLELGGASATS
ncbi:metallophosphoesterase [Notoacmeibacter sp. MSK16QG-6]|uniref:metallophosphoesterase n=1 Tax=Notoacmeibacter sp. MSK16QG-6 TaxID=2957982 RepID=UPI00209FF489|nr:metallophosphoesterase [Notoacmeibacter sp. MSK16QG-6]MCP1200121.1 metallophosphoesterase [Notoacmeibacter sp. MSK16QG-6]